MGKGGGLGQVPPCASPPAQRRRRPTAELGNVKAYLSKMEDLKRDINTQTKRLTQERVKAKALSDELENPLNVHRCGGGPGFQFLYQSCPPPPPRNVLCRERTECGRPIASAFMQLIIKNRAVERMVK